MPTVLPGQGYLVEQGLDGIEPLWERLGIGKTLRDICVRKKITDVTTVSKVREDLRGWNLGRALFIADAGMNSADNREELSKACGNDFCLRVASVDEIKKNVLNEPGRFTQIKDNLKAREVIVGNGERRRRYILCFNPTEAARQKRHRLEVVAILKAKLGKHKDKTATPGASGRSRRGSPVIGG